MLSIRRLALARSTLTATFVTGLALAPHVGTAQTPTTQQQAPTQQPAAPVQASRVPEAAVDSVPPPPHTPQLAAVQVSGTQIPAPPFKAGDRYFFVASDGGLYVKDDILAKPRSLLPTGTFVAVSPSPNGKYIAYGVAGTGTDKYQVRIRDVSTARDLNDVLDNTSISRSPWTLNNRGFFYVRVDTAEHRQRIYYHNVGQAQKYDGIIFSRQDQPDWTYNVRVSDDGQFAVITISHPQDDHTRLYFIDVDNPGKPTIEAPVVKLIDTFGARYTFVDNGGDFFFLQTNRNAPNGRVVLANTEDMQQSGWQTVVPESADTLVFCRTAGEEYLITVSREAGKMITRVYSPPDPREVERAYRRQQDSARRTRGNQPPQDRPYGGTPGGMMGYGGGGMSLFQLNLKTVIPIPTNSSLIDMTSNANDDELFYTVKFDDGTIRSYMYNIKHRTNTVFNTTVGAN